MTEPFLILHKQRGQSTFDIAIRDPDFEDRWIRPADDRRVFPYWWIDIDELLAGETFDPYYVVMRALENEAPGDWPDCAHPETWPDYSPKAVTNPSDAKIAQALLDSLGIKAPPKQNFVRR